MKFPKVIKHRRAEVTIYGKKPSYPFYRIAYRVDGKRRLKSFRTYSEATTAANKVVREISEGSPVAALSPSQARDAIAALDRLRAFSVATGRQISLLAAVSEFAEAAERANGWGLNAAIDGFLKTVATIRRKDLAAAAEEFISLRKTLTVSKEGKRPQLSPEYAALSAGWLLSFAKAFPATAVCDVTKDHLNLYFKSLADQSPKSRNHYRGVIKMFLTWCAKQDYLSQAHRLFEADSMDTEEADIQEIDFFRPGELRKMLYLASTNVEFQSVIPVLVLGGLAGLRLQEILRLEWADIWRVPGHVEVSAKKSKTRSRRLVELCPAAIQWLVQYKDRNGLVFAQCRDTFHTTFGALREAVAIPSRHNGLRHAFCTFHFALYSNENLTAAQAGNSPTMIHKHYKGLAPKGEAESWFSITPQTPAENVIRLASAVNQ